MTDPVPAASKQQVAVVQHCATTDVEKNLSTLESLSRQAVNDGADVVTWPEAFAYLGRHEGKREILEALPEGGPILKRCVTLAQNLNCELLLGGFHEAAPDSDKCFNTSVYLDRDGTIKAMYRKIHLFDVNIKDGPSLQESRQTEAGEKAVSVDTALGRLGLTVCYDVRFPLLYQRLADQGAIALSVPSAFTATTGALHWHTLLKARAIETQSYVIAPAQHGQHSKHRASYGHSLIVDPWGKVIAELDRGDGYVIAEIDSEQVERVRSEIPSLANRRHFTQAARMSDSVKFRGSGIIVLAAIVVIAAGLKASQDLMVPFLLAAFIATIAATPMFWLQKKGLPAAFSLPVVMIFIVLLVFLLGALVTQSASDFTAKLPFYQERLQAFQQDTNRLLQPIIDRTGIEIKLELLYQNFSLNTALEMAGTTLARLGGVLSNSFLILLTVIFILAEAASFPRKLSDVLNDPERDLPYFAQFAENVNRYIGIKTSVSVVTGMIVTLFLWVLGVDFPILWGLLAFLLNYVPTIGSIIAAVPPLILALVQIGFGAAGAVAAGFLAINIIMGNAVEPRFMGRGLGLSTLVVFLSLVVWGWVLGPVGMLLSVPLTMTAKIALEANPDTRWIAHLLGPADALPPLDGNQAQIISSAADAEEDTDSASSDNSRT